MANTGSIGEEVDLYEKMDDNAKSLIDQILVIKDFMKKISSDNFETFKNLRVENNISLKRKDTAFRSVFEDLGLIIFFLLFLMFVISFEYPWYLSLVSIPLIREGYNRYYSRIISKGVISISGFVFMEPDLFIKVIQSYDNVIIDQLESGYRVGDKNQHLDIDITDQAIIMELFAREGIRNTKSIYSDIHSIAYDFTMWLKIILSNNEQLLQEFFAATGNDEYRAIYLVQKEGINRIQNDLPSSVNKIPVTYDKQNLRITIGNPKTQYSLWSFIWLVILVYIFLFAFLFTDTWFVNFMLLLPIIIILKLYMTFGTSTLKLVNFGESELKLKIFTGENGRYQFEFLYLHLKYHLRNYYRLEDIDSESHFGKDNLKFKWPGSGSGAGDLNSKLTIPLTLTIAGKSDAVTKAYNHLEEVLGPEIAIPDPNNYTGYMVRNEELTDFQSNELEKYDLRKSKSLDESGKLINLQTGFMFFILFAVLGSLLLSLVSPVSYGSPIIFDQTGEITNINYIFTGDQMIEFDINIYDLGGDYIEGYITIYLNDQVYRKINFDQTLDHIHITGQRWIGEMTEMRIGLYTPDFANIRVIEGVKYAAITEIGLVMYLIALFINFIGLIFIRYPPTKEEAYRISEVKRLFSVDGFYDGPDIDRYYSKTKYVVSYIILICIMYILSYAYVWYCGLFDADFKAKMQIGYGRAAISTLAFTVFVSFLIVSILSGRTQSSILKFLVFFGTWVLIPFVIPNGYLWLLHPFTKWFGIYGPK